MAHVATNYTIDELISVCIARQVADGDVLAQGIATPLVMAGYLLAKHTHAPHVSFASAIGNALVDEPGAVGLTHAEELWLGRASVTFSFAQAACELLPRFQPKEFFRPAQVDAAGNFNNVVIGADYDHPRMRLPGCGGIADVTAYYRAVYLYVPRHSRAVFVERVDFVSGLGYPPPQGGKPGPGQRLGRGPCYLVSNLGQFDFAGGRMRLIARHPGVTVDKIRAKTGFPLENENENAIPPDLRETEPPTVEELRLLREVIDPLGIRRLETLSGAARKRVLREILASEGQLKTSEVHRQQSAEPSNLGQVSEAQIHIPKLGGKLWN
jgi:glutaconate CoA-transferase subunit B